MHITMIEKEPTKLLNYGLVRLIDSMGSDLSIVRNARVSYDAEWRAGEDEGKDAKLLDYLVKNYHTSPLEAVNFTFEVKAPITVFRQWHRHRTWKFSEISGRYSVLPEQYYIPEISQITTQSVSNKQQRTQEEHPKALKIQAKISNACEASFKEYHELLEMACPRELARTVLPLGTYSHMFATIDFHNLMKFIKLRMHSHAQYEIMVYCKPMLEAARSICPVTVAAVEKHWLTPA